MKVALLTGLFLSSTTLLLSQGYDTEEAPMMRGVTQHIKNGWNVDPIFTVGETDNEDLDYSEERFGYRAPGLLDGIYAYRNTWRKVRAYVNHELQDGRGYPYTLQNGTMLTGARISQFDIDRSNNTVTSVKLAYKRIYDRFYAPVTHQSQLDEGANPGSMDGMDRLCSANGVDDGNYGFEDDLFFTGEETSPPSDVRGGQEFVLDRNKNLYCVPALGRAAWESVTFIENYNTNKVVVLVGDDRQAAPLMMYIGEKDGSYGLGEPSILKRNGLAKGHIFFWVSDEYEITGEIDPSTWNGTGSTRSGKFIRIDHFSVENAGQSGYDAVGWADILTQDSLGDAIGKFQFSRPEDLATNKHDATQAVMASTGRSGFAEDSDLWGTTYLIDFDNLQLHAALLQDIDEIDEIPVNITILYDGDDAGNGQFQGPDYGLRSPDNLEWAADGYIYINEDRSVGGFCSESGVEASLWQLNPENGELTRILEIDRNAVPFQQQDNSPSDCGNWESSGVLDITHLMKAEPGETILLLDVQGHSIDGLSIGGNADLGEGGQLIIASKQTGSVVKSLTVPKALQNQEHSTIPVYPNPVEEVLNLDEKVSFQILDMTGKVLISHTNKGMVDVSELPEGMYILKTSDGRIAEFIKN